MRLLLFLPLATALIGLEELEKQQEEIVKVQDTVNLMARARHYLLEANSTHTETASRRLLVLEELASDAIFSRLITKAELKVSVTQTERNITALEVLHLKPVASFRDSKTYAAANAQNLVVAIGYSDGVLEVVDTSGALIYRYDTGHNGPIRLIAATNSYDGKPSLRNKVHNVIHRETPASPHSRYVHFQEEFHCGNDLLGAADFKSAYYHHVRIRPAALH
jgi:hypothetical protein